MFSATTDGTNITATVPSDIDTSQPIYLRSYLKKKHTVTYDANGGTGSMSATKTGEPVATSTFTRSGYQFTGWNTRADGTGQNVNAGDIASFTANTTLYAQWQVASHTVTFDTNGGNAIAPQTVDDKGKAKEPTAPTRDSWTFAGWYLNGVKYDFTTPVTQDITLKAGWKRVAPSMEFKDMHKRISAGSKSGQQKLTLDVKGTEETNTSTLTSTTMRNTVISDPLSEWVDPVGLVDGKGTGITVSKDGKPMDSGYTAVYDGSSRTVKVSLPDSLDDGSVYSVSFEVALSDKARLNYMQSGTYPDTGDADTGTTSAGKKGYSTNGNATLSWDAVTSTNGTPLIVSHKAKYAKPVTSYDSSNVPPVLTNKLPGTGGIASLMPVFIGAGLALALAAVWIVRKRLSRLP